MLGSVVGKTDVLSLFVPIFLMFFDGLSKDCVDSTVSTFDRGICDRPVRSASQVLDLHHSGKMPYDCVHELWPVIMHL